MKLALKLALAATLLYPAFAFAQATKKAPPELQKEFNVFIAKFRAALKANDSAAVAGMTKLPFEHDSSVRDAAQFRAKTYKQDFTAKNRACLRRSKPVYDRAPSNDDYYSIFCGELIFLFAKTPDGFRFTDIGMND